MIDHIRTLGVVSAAVVASAGDLGAQRELYRSDAFTVTDTSVHQRRFEAVALSRDSIVSTYPRAGREMHFRFSLNGVDNEFRRGRSTRCTSARLGGWRPCSAHGAGATIGPAR